MFRNRFIHVGSGLNKIFMVTMIALCCNSLPSIVVTSLDKILHDDYLYLKIFLTNSKLKIQSLSGKLESDENFRHVNFHPMHSAFIAFA